MMKNFYITMLSLGLIVLSTVAQSGELSGLLKNSNSYNYLEHQWQKQDWQLDIEYNETIANGELTVIGRMLADGVGHLNRSKNANTYASMQGAMFTRSHFSAQLREFYWSGGDTVFWQIGKQQVVWGEADGLKLLDVVNPQSYREFVLDDFEDSRIPLWMIKAEMPVFDESELQLLWIPDTTTHELAPRTSPFALTSPLLVPVASPKQKVLTQFSGAPSKPITDSDLGARLSTFANGWDITLNYLYHYVDEPVIRAHQLNDVTVLKDSYERSHLLGGSASSVFDNWTVRTEVAYETNRFHRSETSTSGVVQSDQIGFVIGLDYQGWTDQFLSVQWFNSQILTSSNRIIKSKSEDVMSLLWDINFFNETLKLRILNLYSLDHQDGLFRSKLTYNLFSNVDVIISIDKFYGDALGVFGQFDHTDSINVGFEWGFD